MPTPHNNALEGDIAKTVLMPGDPLRAKYIAETYLENPICFNTVRNMFGYTGTYKGKKITVMGSGMGMPSIGIYSYELFKFYDVDNIIRIGSAGGYTKDLDVFDVVLATSAFSESSFTETLGLGKRSIMYPSKYITDKIEESANRLNIKVHKGCIHSSDVFYHMNNDYRKKVDENKCVAVEMESFALFANAEVTGKNAACILTISDSFVSHKETTAEERQTSFSNMMELALDTAINL